MKLQKTLERLQKLHPKEIDLSLNRIQNLCKKLGNPQDNLNCIQVCGTNGKYSTIQTMRAILKQAGIKCNIYTSPHIQKINERFVYNDKEIGDSDLTTLLNEVEESLMNSIITAIQNEMLSSFGSRVLNSCAVASSAGSRYASGTSLQLAAQRLAFAEGYHARLGAGSIIS